VSRTQACHGRINDVILRMGSEYALNRPRHAACATCIPVHCIDNFHRCKVPRAGFATAQDDEFVLLRESSHAFAYFQDT
jgi:hypothetical protein